MKHESAEEAWQRLVPRDLDHPLEAIGRKIFKPLSNDQWVEILAAICKNNLDLAGRVPRLARPLEGVAQEETEVFPLVEVISVPSGGRLTVAPIGGGFSCTWKE